jgi:hypothetical protein
LVVLAVFWRLAAVAVPLLLLAEMCYTKPPFVFVQCQGPSANASY